jgi:hypothetical protein
MARAKTPAKVTKPTTTKKKPAAKTAPKSPAQASRGGAKKARTTTVSVRVDASLKKLWEQFDTGLRKARGEESAGFDVYWESVSAIIDHVPPIYLAGGYDSATDFIERHLEEKERSARRWMRVARYASPANLAHYGPSKLDAALSLLEAAGNDLSGGRLPIDFAHLKVVVERDGQSLRVALDAASVDEVVAAVKLARRSTRKPAKGVHPVVKALAAALAADKALRGVTVRRVGARTSLGNIDDAAWPALKRAIRGLTIPVA